VQTEDVVSGTKPFDADRYLSTLRAADLLRTNGKVRQVIGTVVESNGPPMSIGETAQIIYRRSAEPVLAEAVGFRDSKVLLMPLGDLGGIAAGSDVVALGHPLQIGLTASSTASAVRLTVSGASTMRRRPKSRATPRTPCGAGA
jgi:flagellar biosynthesis/type III secretory pathway ATPase